jgi:hypothetical protein
VLESVREREGGRRAAVQLLVEMEEVMTLTGSKKKKAGWLPRLIFIAFT